MIQCNIFDYSEGIHVPADFAKHRHEIFPQECQDFQDDLNMPKSHCQWYFSFGNQGIDPFLPSLRPSDSLNVLVIGMKNWDVSVSWQVCRQFFFSVFLHWGSSL